MDIYGKEDEEKALNSFSQSHLTSSPTPNLRRLETETNEVTDLSLRAVDPVNVSVRNLTVEVDLKPSFPLSLFSSKTSSFPTSKTILHNVSANMPQGTLTAIIGSSGSGKTSMLNIMAHRMKGGRLSQTGNTYYNGSRHLSSVRSAYVLQQDVLAPTLTVRETLQYAAELRLPPPTTQEERFMVVEEIILELGLKECANTRIGNNAQKGCSGGEKRRTSLGVQMLANPSVLFLDEVTTGLDATSAYQLVKTLKYLASKGRTVITTIHQPRSEIWGLFDNLVLLTGGCSIYAGPANESITHFDKLGYPLPPFVNPAEHLIDLAAVDTRSPDREQSSSSRVQALKEAWLGQKRMSNGIFLDADDLEHVKNDEKKKPRQHQAGFSRQVRVQTARSLKTTFRDPLGLTGSIIETICLGVASGWVFYQLPETQAGIRSREGALYTVAALQGYLILLFETYRLTLDIELFDRERGEGVVGPFSFLISRRLSRLCLEDIPVPLIFSVIYYFMVGFRAEPNQFFIFFGVVLIAQFIAVTLAMLCVALFRDYGRASLVGNLSYTIQTICSGFFIQSNQIPIYVRWLKYTAYVWYANGALVTNEFLAHTTDPQGQLYACPSLGGTANPDCKTFTGLYIVQALGYPTNNWLWRPIVIILGYPVLFFFLSALVLYSHKIDLSISRQRAPDTDLSAGKEDIRTNSVKEVRTIDITLTNYSLDIQKRTLLGKNTEKLSILKPINATFRPGVLNVILGPSGSGKTSLLNRMAGRLNSTFVTQYQPAGDMLFGGAIPSAEVIRSVTSYVSQDDDALLSTLTVRETLHYAAMIRLPKFMTKEQKHQRAESVLLKLGLKDCANNIIGSDKKKGISGGEKRRVTIAIQILTDPRILFLDEPTSGLDAFTAVSIIDVLRGLAAEGRTLVLTIHQARSDLFQHFGNVLLLARGGSPVYAGAGNHMLSHFSALGYDCARTTNPADFALDLITIDLQHARKERRSRQKVDSLILEWTRAKPLEPTTSHIATPAELGSLKRDMAPFYVSFPLLVQRSSISLRRDADAVAARTSQVIGFAVIVALFFSPLRNNFEAVQTRLGYIQQWMGLYFVGMLQNVAVYPAERAVFYREHDDRAYGISAFFLQYTLLEIPFEILSAIFFSLLCVLAAGLPRSASLFFIVSFNCFAIVNCGESIGIMFNTIFNHTGFAVNIISVVLSIGVMMAGILSLDMPPVLNALNNLSPAKWAVANTAPYTLRGVVFTCTDAQRLSNGRCPIETGEQALQLYGLDKEPGTRLLALGICIIAYRLVSYGLLMAIRGNWSLGMVMGWIKRRKG